jgi:glycosyltransferase involved in cell wall biosynthesis
VVLSHPTQYYSPWFRWVAANTSLQLRVFYLWDFGISARVDPKFERSVKWDVDLLSGYEHEFVPNVAVDPGTHHFWGLKNPALGKRLSAWRPDAILIFGYKWWTQLRAIGWARMHGVPLIFRGDSHVLGDRKLSRSNSLLLRILYSQFSAFLCVGKANTQYFKQFGVPVERLFLAPHSVNDELFDATNASYTTGAEKLRSELGIGPEQQVILFAGKLVPEKQPLMLLDAFINVAPENATLVFVGDGPEKPLIEKRIAQERPGRVFRLPFANQSEMPIRYLLADIFVLPSGGLYETWGLAVNEAMHLGVPALVSDRVGCQQDLVTDGDTGWVFPATDRDAFARRLHAAIHDMGNEKRRKEVKAAVRTRIAAYTYRQTTDGLCVALRAALRTTNAAGPSEP